MSTNVQPFRSKDPDPARLPGGAWPFSTDEVFVVFTTADETLAAVPVARRFADAFRGRLTVVHFRTIPFAAPLEMPTGVSPAEADRFTERLQEVDDEADVKICVCRDARRALPHVFPGRSLVVMGRRGRWWPTAADRWRRTLEAAGHTVVLTDGPARA